MSSRRNFLRQSAGLAAGAIGAQAAETAPHAAVTENTSLCGTWEFQTDSTENWRSVTVTHTWQIELMLANYRGVAWYRRTFEAPRAWHGSAVRVEFEAVFHSAKVLMNDHPGGEHVRKGYTEVLQL
jgi:beta-glucuronidase